MEIFMKIYYEPDSSVTMQDAIKFAKINNNGFLLWNGKLFFKNKDLGSIEDCISEVNGLHDKLIFNTDFKLYKDIVHAYEVFNKTGYPFFKWNGMVYDNDGKAIDYYSKLSNKKKKLAP